MIEFDRLGDTSFRELPLQDVFFTWADLVQTVQDVAAADRVRGWIEFLRRVGHF